MTKYYSNTLRIISIITLIAFVSTQVAWGYEGRAASTSPQKSQLRSSQAAGNSVGDDIANSIGAPKPQGDTAAKKRTVPISPIKYFVLKLISGFFMIIFPSAIPWFTILRVKNYESRTHFAYSIFDNVSPIISIINHGYLNDVLGVLSVGSVLYMLNYFGLPYKLCKILYYWEDWGKINIKSMQLRWSKIIITSWTALLIVNEIVSHIYDIVMAPVLGRPVTSAPDAADLLVYSLSALATNFAIKKLYKGPVLGNVGRNVFAGIAAGGVAARGGSGAKFRTVLEAKPGLSPDSNESVSVSAGPPGIADMAGKAQEAGDTQSVGSTTNATKILIERIKSPVDLLDDIEELEKNMPENARMPRSVIENFLENPDCIMLVAKDEKTDSILGCIYGVPEEKAPEIPYIKFFTTREEKPHTFYTISWQVLPEHQGRNIGMSLVKQFTDEVYKAGYRYVSLHRAATFDKRKMDSFLLRFGQGDKILRTHSNPQSLQYILIDLKEHKFLNASAAGVANMAGEPKMALPQTAATKGVGKSESVPETGTDQQSKKANSWYTAAMWVTPFVILIIDLLMKLFVENYRHGSLFVSITPHPYIHFYILYCRHLLSSFAAPIAPILLFSIFTVWLPLIYYLFYWSQLSSYLLSKDFKILRIALVWFIVGKIANPIDVVWHHGRYGVNWLMLECLSRSDISFSREVYFNLSDMLNIISEPMLCGAAIVVVIRVLKNKFFKTKEKNRPVTAGHAVEATVNTADRVDKEIVSPAITAALYPDHPLFHKDLTSPVVMSPYITQEDMRNIYRGINEQLKSGKNQGNFPIIFKNRVIRRPIPIRGMGKKKRRQQVSKPQDINAYCIWARLREEGVHFAVVSRPDLRQKQVEHVGGYVTISRLEQQLAADNGVVDAAVNNPPKDFAKEKALSQKASVLYNADGTVNLQKFGGWLGAPTNIAEIDIRGLIKKWNELPFSYTTLADIVSPKAELESKSRDKAMVFMYISNAKQVPSKFDELSKNKVVILFKTDKSDTRSDEFVKMLSTVSAVKLVEDLSPECKSPVSKSWVLFVEVPESVIVAQDIDKLQAYLDEKWHSVEQVIDKFLSEAAAIGVANMAGRKPLAPSRKRDPVYWTGLGFTAGDPKTTMTQAAAANVVGDSESVPKTNILQMPISRRGFIKLIISGILFFLTASILEKYKIIRKLFLHFQIEKIKQAFPDIEFVFISLEISHDTQKYLTQLYDALVLTKDKYPAALSLLRRLVFVMEPHSHGAAARGQRSIVIGLSGMKGTFPYEYSGQHCLTNASNYVEYTFTHELSHLIVNELEVSLPSMHEFYKDLVDKQFRPKVLTSRKNVGMIPIYLEYLTEDVRNYLITGRPLATFGYVDSAKKYYVPFDVSDSANERSVFLEQVRKKVLNKSIRDESKPVPEDSLLPLVGVGPTYSKANGNGSKKIVIRSAPNDTVSSSARRVVVRKEPIDHKIIRIEPKRKNTQSVLEAAPKSFAEEKKLSENAAVLYKPDGSMEKIEFMGWLSAPTNDAETDIRALVKKWNKLQFSYTTGADINSPKVELMSEIRDKADILMHLSGVKEVPSEFDELSKNKVVILFRTDKSDVHSDEFIEKLSALPDVEIAESHLLEDQSPVSNSWVLFVKVPEDIIVVQDIDKIQQYLDEKWRGIEQIIDIFSVNEARGAAVGLKQNRNREVMLAIAMAHRIMQEQKTTQVIVALEEVRRSSMPKLIIVIGNENLYQLEGKGGNRIEYVKDIQEAEKIKDENQDEYIVIIINGIDNSLQISNLPPITMTGDVRQAVGDFLRDV